METQPKRLAVAPPPVSAPNAQDLVSHAEAESRARGLWLLGLALLAFAVRAQTIFYGFVYDDSFNIVQRAPADWSRIPSFFTTNQSAFYGSNFYRPVVSIWQEVCYGLFGTHAAVWHLLSVLLHVACALLVFYLALAVTEDRVAAWIAAALFAVHPAHVEAVTWVAAVGDLLMTLLMLCSMLAFLRWMERGKLAWWAGSFAAASVCLLTKETAVVLPVVLLAMALAFRSQAKPGLPVLAATIPFFAIALIYMAVRQAVLGSFAHVGVQAGNTAQMIFTWPPVLLFYLRHMFWPAAVVPYNPLSFVKSWNSREFIGPLLGVIAAVVVLLYLLLRSAGWRRCSLCIVWILAPLAPVLYLKVLPPLDLVHDRFLYAPLVGFCIAAGLVLKWASERIEAKVQWRVLPIMAVVLIPLLSLKSISEAFWWESNTTLFTRALTVTPDNVRALDNLAYAHISEHRYRQAEPLLHRALEIEPRDSGALFGLGRIAWLDGNDSAAETYLKQAVAFRPTYDMWLHLASVELHMKHLDEAEAAARKAIAMNSNTPGVHVALGAVLLAKRDRVGAAREFQEELRVFPESEPARAGLAQATGGPPR